MIRHARTASNGWNPGGFSEFAQHYPDTLWQPVPKSLDLSDDFVTAWHETNAPQPQHESAIVLTPGLFAEWLPGCFSEAQQAFRQAGYRVLRSRVRSSRGVFEQADWLIAEVSHWLSGDERFIWCGHSKGAIELLCALEKDASLRERCAAAIVVQPPVGTSHVLKHFESSEASIGQRLSNRVLRSRLFCAGARDISTDRDPALRSWLRTFTASVPTLCIASWSVEPTHWIDSWHRTLAKACPGIAHDGQFLTSDQLLPHTPVVALPRIDHAQPVLGGNGFDPGRFWKALATVAAGPALQELYANVSHTK